MTGIGAASANTYTFMEQKLWKFTRSRIQIVNSSSTHHLGSQPQIVTRSVHQNRNEIVIYAKASVTSSSTCFLRLIW